MKKDEKTKKGLQAAQVKWDLIVLYNLQSKVLTAD
jgi:hypothetical protein